MIWRNFQYVSVGSKTSGFFSRSTCCFESASQSSIRVFSDLNIIVFFIFTEFIEFLVASILLVSRFCVMATVPF
jgi:hypothetical protein